MVLSRLDMIAKSIRLAELAGDTEAEFRYRAFLTESQEDTADLESETGS